MSTKKKLSHPPRTREHISRGTTLISGLYYKPDPQFSYNGPTVFAYTESLPSAKRLLGDIQQLFLQKVSAVSFCSLVRNNPPTLPIHRRMLRLGDSIALGFKEVKQGGDSEIANQARSSAGHGAVPGGKSHSQQQESRPRQFHNLQQNLQL